MMVSVAKTNSILKKRLLRFFDKKSERSSVHNFLDDLEDCVDVYVYGGLIRDIALYGTASFNSDIDLVYVDEKKKFDDFIAQYSATRNKFGGYRLVIGKWKIDIWEASNTWAFAKGYKQYSNITSLLKTTITNWDSILFDWKHKKLIYQEGYFDDLIDNYLDINFKENPNELGMYVRILRYYVTKDAKKFSTKAVYLIKEAVEKHTYDDIRSYEHKSYKDSFITESIYHYLKGHSQISSPDLLPVELDHFNKTKDLLSN